MRELDKRMRSKEVEDNPTPMGVYEAIDDMESVSAAEYEARSTTVETVVLHLLNNQFHKLTESIHKSESQRK